MILRDSISSPAGAAVARGHDWLRARYQQEGRLRAEAPPAASGQPVRCCLPAARPQGQRLPAASPQRGGAHRGADRRGGCRRVTGSDSRPARYWA
ncbi:hypothetical protein GW17_00058351 [Ensete ventricosum]|nr:hypothetical protein GW17_00058351 [Ensete ventricosum]